MSGAIVFAGIAPHPPLLVPEVGGARVSQVAGSTLAMKTFSQRLMQSAPDSIVLISPHSPLDSNSFTARAETTLSGDFGEFLAPSVRLEFSNDLALLQAIEKAVLQCDGDSSETQGGQGERKSSSSKASSKSRVSIRRLAGHVPLDHGVLVPMYYLAQAGWSGPLVVFGFTLQPDSVHIAFGEAIRQAAIDTNKRVAIVASGDLSHRLKVGGPYEFEPIAHLFDEQVVAAIERGAPEKVLAIDPELRQRAGECGYRSIVVAVGSTIEATRKCELLHYEGPFGVGYMVAILLDEDMCL
jgi:aromatic ring-opening dioxygenase LigB subunit